MREYRLTDGEDERRLELRDAAEPRAGAGELVVRMRAQSLNYRDLIVLGGGYPRNDRPGVVPLSDGAGEIAGVGAGVEGWAVGDRVAINFMRDWHGGEVDDRALDSSFGGGVDGVLADLVAVPAGAVARIPDWMGFAEAATLPCAGVTAWHGLRRAGVTAGDTVLLLGTGGVSVFGLQLAQAMGARTIVTSSSDDKLARARAMGAAVGINYRTRPDWDAAAREATGGRGVDAVIEVGGPGTLARSIAATRTGGSIALIGLLTDDPPPALTPVLLNALTVHGIYVGSTAMLRELIAAVDLHRIRPVVDRRFAFEDAAGAYDYFRRQEHVGKVVITDERD
jgi:NADPH:quinone reductase-like Zn-dependent oxidoreductase